MKDASAERPYAVRLYLPEMTRIGKSRGPGSRLVVAQGWGTGGWEVTANGSGVCLEGDGNVLTIRRR